MRDDPVQYWKTSPQGSPVTWRNVLTFHQECPVTGHLASDVGGCAAVIPSIPCPGSQQAEAMRPTIFIKLSGAFPSPHGGTFQEPGHLGLRDP